MICSLLLFFTSPLRLRNKKCSRFLTLRTRRRVVIQGRHVNCYRAIALKLLIISKDVSDKSFSVRECCHTRPPYFFSMTLLPILRQIQRPSTQGHSSHAKYKNSRKIETYRNNQFQRIH